MSRTRAVRIYREAALHSVCAIEFAEAEEKGEVTSDGSKNDACLGMAERPGRPDGTEVQKESLGAWGVDRIWKTWNSQCRISKFILEATGNPGVLEAIWKEILELAILPVEED